MKIVIFSDLHYANINKIEDNIIFKRKLTKYADDIIDKLIDKINTEIKPDLVINLGDLIEDSNNHDEDIKSLNHVWNKLKNINCPFYSCIGNHDIRSLKNKDEIEDIMGYDNSTFSFDLKGLHVIILGIDIDNNLSNELGGIIKTQYISYEDLEWLKKDLKNNKLPTIICTHFGIAEDDMKDNWWFNKDKEQALLKNRDDLKKIINKDKNILGVFSGHQHWTKKIIENNISYYIVGSLTENINNDNKPDGVYYLVDFKDGKLNIKDYHIKL